MATRIRASTDGNFNFKPSSESVSGRPRSSSDSIKPAETSSAATASVSDGTSSGRYAKGNKISQAFKPAPPGGSGSQEVPQQAEHDNDQQGHSSNSKGTRTLRRNRAHLYADVRAKIAELRPSEEGLARVQRCIQALNAVMGELGSEWRVSPFGSAANGFGTRNSDLDVTCHREDIVSDEDKRGEYAAHRVLAEDVLPVLREQPNFSVTEEILFARVPILKLCFEGVLEVDLSCHNTKPLENTRLLSAYASFDANVRNLGVAVKTWAKAAQVCGAQQSHLSSYAFTLLAIYYMQVEHRLPRLPTSAFADDGEGLEDERVLAAKAEWSPLSTESHTLVHLLVDFFAFYAHKFSWGSEVVSVRYGARWPPTGPLFSTLKGRNNNRLHIEDPCDNTRNLNCVLGKVEEQQLYAAFQDAWLAMHGHRAPVGLGAVLRSQQKQSQREVASAPESKDAAGFSQAPSESTIVGSYNSADSTASGSGPSTPALTPSAPATGKKIIECGDLEAALLATQAEESLESSPWWGRFMESGAAAEKATNSAADATWYQLGEIEAKIVAGTKGKVLASATASEDTDPSPAPARENRPVPGQAPRRSRMGRMGPRSPNSTDDALIRATVPSTTVIAFQ